MDRMVEIKKQMEANSKEIKSFYDRKIYMYEGGTAAERSHLHELIKEQEELDTELFDIELSHRSALHN